MTPELLLLLERTALRPMTDEEREEQIRNFAAGNVGMENPRVTRERIDRAAGKIQRQGA